jgi:LPS-assembly lipoprotein
MSLPDEPQSVAWPSRRDWLRSTILRNTVVIGAIGSLLAACGNDGFRPLYGPTPTGAPLSERMAAVSIAPIGGRVGQRIRNELIFTSTGGGLPAPPQYTFEIVIRESVTSTLVRSTGEASSQVYALEANFRLIRIRDKVVVLQGQSAGRAGFERYTNIFSNVRAREDAENRAAKTVAEDLKSRLATFLATNAA